MEQQLHMPGRSWFIDLFGEIKAAGLARQTHIKNVKSQIFMCGIAGIFTPDRSAASPELSQALHQMTRLMARRGPDDEGFWVDPQQRLQLGFRRLRILDLTPSGNQPMISHDGDSVIVFNGEIYNFRELRSRLEVEGEHFHSRSDTEVLLNTLNRWGESAISRLNGMFAFAWYDSTKRFLVLARDHAGIKPLYYTVNPVTKSLAFSSQYNCLLQIPWVNRNQVDPQVLALYLRLHHIPAPYALLRNTHQLEPGSMLMIDASGKIEKRKWWELDRNSEPDLHGEEALETLQDALNDSVERQRIADVPLGVFLSGGVDSPLVAAIARKQAGPDLKAYTIGNPGWWQDESYLASVYSGFLDLRSKLCNITAQEALEAIRDVIQAQHEPFGDFSILPTLLVSRYARQEVTVALSGDGGDELFFGYERPVSLLRNGADFRWPRPLRLALYVAGKYGLGAKRSSAIVSKTPGDYYFEVNSRIKKQDLRQWAPSLKKLPEDFNLYHFREFADLDTLAQDSRWVEYYGQLQRGLKKVDMASMYNSLEVRVPLLDRKVIDVSLRLDPFECIRNGTRKTVLRDLLGRYVPRDVIPKPKRGFAVPLGDWLRGPLKSLVEDTLFQRPLYPEGVFDVNGLRTYWEQHLTGRRDLKWGLWTLMTLQWWAGNHGTSA